MSRTASDGTAGGQRPSKLPAAALVLPEDNNALTHIPSHSTSAAAARRRIVEGNGLVLQTGEKDPVFTFIDLKRGSRVRLGKSNVNVDALIGGEFGSFWEIDRGALRRTLCWRAPESHPPSTVSCLPMVFLMLSQLALSTRRCAGVCCTCTFD
jgi:hypothetical protein